MKELEKLAADLEAITPYLLSGGAGALATGIAASRIKRDPKKSRLADLGKKLAITLGGGLAAAGVHKAINTAGESFKNALPAGDVSTEEKIVNTAGNKDLVRLLATGGTATGLYAAGARHDKKQLKGLPGNLGESPDMALRSQIAAMRGDNKLKSFIESAAEVEKPKFTASEQGELNDLKKQLERKPTDPNRDSLLAKVEELKNKISESELDHTNRAKALIQSKLESAGFNVGDYEPGRLSKFKQAIKPKASRIYGRSMAGKAGKLTALLASLGTPEIASGIGNLLSGNQE